jgi:dGTPase
VGQSVADKLNWDRLLCEDRRKGLHNPKPALTETAIERRPGDTRTEHERDHDRILFSAPLRRLQDKTQVFPLEKNDSVRTRLTHSHEVANMARSMGTTLAFEHATQVGFPNPDRAKRSVPALLEAIGLAHDIGNPPFGHQGEEAIRTWVLRNSVPVKEDALSRGIFDGWGPTKAQKEDFLRFEGNAQAFRLLTQLQIINDGFGLNMTCAFLASLMKYPVSSDTASTSLASKKFGFFQSEASIVEEVWNATGLKVGVRHPLTFVMEACDDIAYSVVDAEDGAKKSLLNFNKLADYLKRECDGDPVTERVLEKAYAEYARALGHKISPSEIDDIAMQMFRVNAIGAMVPSTIRAFVDNIDPIMSGEFNYELLAKSDASRLWKSLKKFSFEHIYTHGSVLVVESAGHSVIHRLMDMFWDAIHANYDAKQQNRRPSPLVQYTYLRISENYRRVYEDPKSTMSEGYKRLQLITDMVSGMTDSFAVALCDELRRCNAS